MDGVIGNTGLYLPGLSELLTQSYGVIRSYPRVDGVIGNTGLYLPRLLELLMQSYRSYGVIRSSTLGYDLITP